MLLIGVVSGTVSAFIVISYSKYIQFKRMEKMSFYAQSMLEELEDRVIDARLEFDEGMIRMYDSETDEFLAQGKTWDELNDILKFRFPNKLFNVKQEQIDRASQYSK